MTNKVQGSTNMKPIKILLVVGSMDRGGVETLLMNILRNINKSYIKLIFLCYKEKKYDYEDEIISLGSKIIVTPDVKEVGIIKHIQNLITIIKNESIDIVHAHTYFNSMFSMIAAKIAGVKIRITHSHNTQSEEFPSFAKRIYFRISKFLINTLATNYLACGQDAGRAMFYKGNRFTIIDNGIILDDFRYNPTTRNHLRDELNITRDKTVILHVGRFDRQKNHDFLIDIYNEYAKLKPTSVLVLVGDGPLRTEIEKKIADYGIAEKVLFLGKRSDVNELYNIADLFLFPSLFEGLPVTLVEAQANGLVCLISNTIDKTSRFTDCIEFYPLESSPGDWAQRMTQLNLKRIDTKALTGGPYDMVQNAKEIEQVYSLVHYHEGGVV